MLNHIPKVLGDGLGELCLGLLCDIGGETDTPVDVLVGQAVSLSTQAQVAAVYILPHDDPCGELTVVGLCDLTHADWDGEEHDGLRLPALTDLLCGGVLVCPLMANLDLFVVFHFADVKIE